MKEYIVTRVYETAKYIQATNATVRDTAVVFCISKSTVHKDVTERLKQLDPILHDTIHEILSQNLSERHIRGGQATKRKFKGE